MEKHFVTFYSPGTFVSEETTKEIESWDVKAAMEMAHGIKERHGATPYGFRFTTRSRGEKDLDSRVSKYSPFYWLGGKIETIVVNDNSWRFTAPFRDDDVMLDWLPRK